MAGVGGNETSGSLPPAPTEQTGRLHFGCITVAETRVDSYDDITFWGLMHPIIIGGSLREKEEL